MSVHMLSTLLLAKFPLKLEHGRMKHLCAKHLYNINDGIKIVSDTDLN